jgi:6-pyruvoyl-tetrahydropterin synthase
VLDRVDHRHLNEALEEFGPGGRVPSSENLVLWIRARLSEGLPEGCRLVGLRLAEDDDLAASWEP